jgi:hypothetical protein
VPATLLLLLFQPDIGGRFDGGCDADQETK